jgi:hypothetical protein
LRRRYRNIGRWKMRCPFAMWLPGPSSKRGYRGAVLTHKKTGAVLHTAEYDTDKDAPTLYNALFEEGREASWTFTITREGFLFQHYETGTVTWHSGSYEGNLETEGIEHEGYLPDKIDGPQYTVLVKLLKWLREIHEWEEWERKKNLWEHNEQSYSYTDCQVFTAGMLDTLVTDLGASEGEGMEPYLRDLWNAEDEIFADVEQSQDVVRREIRHVWSEDVGPEHTAWGALSDEYFKANERTYIWGRPGKRWKLDTEAPFDLAGITEKPASFVTEALSNAPNYGNGVDWIPLDGKYFLASNDDIAKIIGWDWTDAKEYILNQYDCENFAFSFKARVEETFLVNQVGLVIDWSSAHAYNVIVTKDGELWFFEPQSDTIVETGSGLYKMERAVILL